jgi:hypothetical protein
MSFDFSTLIWILVAATVLQPLLMGARLHPVQCRRHYQGPLQCRASRRRPGQAHHYRGGGRAAGPRGTFTA